LAYSVFLLFESGHLYRVGWGFYVGMSRGEVVELLRELDSKLDVILNRLKALERHIIMVEEAEPEDREAYHEALREYREGLTERLD